LFALAGAAAALGIALPSLVTVARHFDWGRFFRRAA
jgi:hypothetical protein